MHPVEFGIEADIATLGHSVIIGSQSLIPDLLILDRVDHGYGDALSVRGLVIKEFLGTVELLSERDDTVDHPVPVAGDVFADLDHQSG